MSAEVGIIMTSGIAFRSFFVSARRKEHDHATKSGSGTRIRALLGLLTPKMWRSKKTGNSGSNDVSDPRYDCDLHDLPKVPRGTLTGVQTFINGRGKNTGSRFSRMTSSRTMDGSVILEDVDEVLPLYHKTHEQPEKAIRVQHDIVSTTEA
jgi:hypothetical protein